jgi:hypothetical protein
MTYSLGLAHRIRWNAAIAAVSMLLLALSVAFAASRGQVGSLPSSSASAGSGIQAGSGSSAALDPRIAGLARSHPDRSVQVIVQFKAGISQARARKDAAGAGGRVFGELHVIPALAVKMTAAQARALSASPDVHAVSLNAVIRTSDLPGPGGQSGPGGQ